jgi:hypothetical protein
MNCLEFRRHKLAFPRKIEPAHNLHVQACAPCAEFSARANVFENEIEQAARVPMPEGLADRVILRHKFRARRRFSLFGLAATLLLAAGLTFTHSYLASEARIAEALIAHVLHEPEALQANHEVSEVKVASALAQAGGELRGPIGHAVYYKLCPVPGGEGAHIVLVTPFGRATLLLMPEKEPASRAPLTRQGFSAAVLPLGRGSVGVVAESPQELEQMTQLLREQVTWKT